MNKGTVSDWSDNYKELDLKGGKINFIIEDDEDGWKNPVAQINIQFKKDLVSKIQEIIYKFR